MAIIKRETDYAVRAMARLAHDAESLPVSTLAREEDIPELFLRKIMQTLSRAGFVESRQGPFGGYHLARPPGEVTVLDILEAVQGPLVMNECFATPEVCGRVDFCPLRKRLAELQVELNASLDKMSLADIVDAIAATEGARK